MRQVQTHPPATGEISDLTIHLLIGEPQAGQQFARARIGGVTVGAVQLGVQTGLRGAVMCCFGGCQIRLHLTQAKVAIEDVVHGDSLKRVDLLAHVSNAPVGR